MTNTDMDLAQLPNSVLTARLYELRKQERVLLVEFLIYLAEVDRRDLYLDIGFSSLFSFLTDYLGYTKGSAFRRSTACRLYVRFPIVADYLGDGRLGLTTLVELREVLDESSLISVLDRAAGKTEERVKELVAALRPRPEPMDLFRRLPEPTVSVEPPPPPPPSPPPPRPTLTPISEERRVLRMTVGRDFVTDLEAVKSALSHQIPDGNLEQIMHECLRRTLSLLTRRRQGTGKPSRGPRPPTGRYVTAAVRNEVFRRDEGRCTFVGSDGHRCNSTHQLELHHRRAYALGGPPTVENLTLHCARHNRHVAKRELGTATRTSPADRSAPPAPAGAGHPRA